MSKKIYYFLVFSFPALFFLIIFIIYPLILDIISSFSDWSPIAFNFVGLSNYALLFQDPLFYSALQSNLIWLAVNVPASMALGLLFALLLTSEDTVGPKVYRTMIFTALAIPPTIAAFIFGYMLFSSNTGFINAVFFHNELNVFGLYWPALFMMILITIWSTAPLATIIYMAGVSLIPRSVVEAALIDGAPAPTRFFRIYLPLLKPAHIISFVMLSILTLKVFDVVYTLRAPGGASVLLYYMYNQMAYGMWGYSNTIILILIIIILSIAIPLTIIMFKK